MTNYKSKRKHGGKKSPSLRSLYNHNRRNVIINCNKELVNKYKSCSKNKDYKCANFRSCKKLFNNNLTGWEPKYSPQRWNTNKYIRKSHNCYIYALDDHNPITIKNCKNKSTIDKCSDLKPQPRKWASLKGISDNNRRNYTCKDVYKSVKLDNKHIKKCSFTDKCPSGFYKAALVVDPLHTYHFYRQDSNGEWSHKQGTLPIEKVDASNNMIFAPHLADRNYNKQNKTDGINYTDFCSYFCVPHNEVLKTYAI